MEHVFQHDQQLIVQDENLNFDLLKQKKMKKMEQLQKTIKVKFV